MSSLDPLRTARLVGHPLAPEHLEDLRALARDPRVMATLRGGKAPEDPAADAAEMLAREIAHWKEHGFGLWAFFLRDDVPHEGDGSPLPQIHRSAEERPAGEESASSFVGRAGLRRVTIEDVEEVMLSYALVAEHWGHGFATEIANAVCETAFGALGLRDLVALALPANRVSRRVMEKTGFRYEREVERHGLPHVLYRRRRPAPGSRKAKAA